jgi:hypothetical protein
MPYQFAAAKYRARATPVLSLQEKKYLSRQVARYVVAKSQGSEAYKTFLFDIGMSLVLRQAEADTENWNGNLWEWRQSIDMCDDQYLWLVNKRKNVRNVFKFVTRRELT